MAEMIQKPSGRMATIQLSQKPAEYIKRVTIKDAKDYFLYEMAGACWSKTFHLLYLSSYNS